MTQSFHVLELMVNVNEFDHISQNFRIIRLTWLINRNMREN